jgi:hypothetical protein
MREDRLLRSGNYEPWSFVFLYSALGLLEAHLALKTPGEAKASSVERFKNLQYKFHQTRPSISRTTRMPVSPFNSVVNGPLPPPSPLPNVGGMSSFQQATLPPLAGMSTTTPTANFLTQDFTVSF